MLKLPADARITPREIARMSKGDDGEGIIYYLVDWLPPDFGAVGQYAAIFARELARAGRRVILVGLTSGVGGSTHEALDQGGFLEIKRISARRYNKSSLLARLNWSVRTNLRLIGVVVRDRRSRDAEVLFTGSPPFMLYFAFLVKWTRGARLSYRITDFYPEVISASLARRPVPLAAIERITWYLRRRVDNFQVLGEDQRRILIDGGVAPSRITLKRDVSPVAIRATDKPTPAPVELARHKILLYSGNFGVAHEVTTLVDGLMRHHRGGGGQFALWLNASGSAVQQVTGSLRAAGIPFVQTDPVPLDQLPGLLAAADVHLISLRSSFSGYVLPSKVYACLSSGRPILFLGPATSDVHLLCTQESNLVYERVEPGDAEGFAAALERLALAASSKT